MPIYEYQCTECHENKECLQKISDPVLVTCSNCQKDTLIRLVSGAGFKLKGTGWYQTDFKTKDATNKSNANNIETNKNHSTRGDE